MNIKVSRANPSEICYICGRQLFPAEKMCIDCMVLAPSEMIKKQNKQIEKQKQEIAELKRLINGLLCIVKNRCREEEISDEKNG